LSTHDARSQERRRDLRNRVSFGLKALLEGVLLVACSPPLPLESTRGCHVCQFVVAESFLPSFRVVLSQ
jgi:hypothetical protein